MLEDARYQWAMKRLKVGADPASRVPAIRARCHLRALEAAGMTRTVVAQRAGVSAGTISRLAKPTTKRVSRITAAAVLGVVA
jgi:hypothetical protein